MADSNRKTGSEDNSEPVSIPAPRTGSEPALAIFAGVGAAAVLAQQGEVRPMRAIRKAEDMRRAGAKDTDIHRETSKMLEGTPYAGVTYGKDRKPRFEIDDSGAKLVRSAIPKDGATFQKDFLQHPELYKAVPSAQHLVVSKSTTNNSSVSQNDIELGAKHFTAKPLAGREIAYPSAIGPNLHELQHHVQDLEGHAPGGSPSDFAKRYPNNPEMQRVAYQTLAGEQEAETTRRRQHMTAAERRSNMPVDDIPKSAQIIGPKTDVKAKIDLTSIKDAANAAMNTVLNRDIADNKPARFRKLDPRNIVADAKTFQFKSHGDESGVTDRLKGVTSWDSVAAGKAVVYERANGELVIADGHQRLGLAKRLAAQGQDVRMDAYVLRERDGWHARDVYAYAAMKNIKESSGNSLDMAKVMRERPDMINGSVPMSDAKVREAANLSKLSSEAFNMVVGGAIKPEFAAAVGSRVGDQSRHVDLLTEMAKANISTSQHANLYVGQALAAPQFTETQSSLFGEQKQTRSLLAERSQVLDKALTALKSDKRIFGLLEREAANIESAGNKLSHATNAARAGDAGQTAALIEKLALTRGPVSAMLDQAAIAVAEGKKPGIAARSFVKSVGDAVKAGGMNALTGDMPALAPVPVDPNQENMFGEKNPGWSDKAREASAMARAGEASGKGKRKMMIEDVFNKNPRNMVKKTSPEAEAKWGKILDETPVDPKEAKTLARKKAERLGASAKRKMMVDDGKDANLDRYLKAVEGVAKKVGDPLGIGEAISKRPITDTDMKIVDAIDRVANSRVGKFLQDPLGIGEAVTDMFGGPSTKDKIDAASRAKDAKGRTGDAMDVGLFSSDRNQTDLVDMAKAAKKQSPILSGIESAATELSIARRQYNSLSMDALPSQKRAAAAKIQDAHDKINAIRDTIPAPKSFNDPNNKLRSKIGELANLVDREGMTMADKTVQTVLNEIGKGPAGWSDEARKASAKSRSESAKPKNPDSSKPLMKDATVKHLLKQGLVTREDVKKSNTLGVLKAKARESATQKLKDRGYTGGKNSQSIYQEIDSWMTPKDKAQKLSPRMGGDGPIERPRPGFAPHKVAPPRVSPSQIANARHGSDFMSPDPKRAAQLEAGWKAQNEAKPAKATSGKRGTQNAANLEAIVANKKAKAANLPRAEAIAKFTKLMNGAPNGSWSTRDLNSAIRSQEKVNARREAGLDPEWSKSMSAAAEPHAITTKPPRTSEPLADPIKVIEKRNETARSLADQTKATGIDGGRGAAARDLVSRSEADLTKLEKHAATPQNDGESRWISRARAAQSVKTDAELLTEYRAKKETVTKRGPKVSRALGIALAPAAIGIAMLAASNQAKAAGRAPTERAKEVAKAGAETTAVIGAFAVGSGLAVTGLVKAGVSLAKAVPGVNVALMAGNAVYEAVKAEPGHRMAAAARGAWDMSLPGMVVNTAKAGADAISQARTVQPIPVVATPAKAKSFEAANADFNAAQKSQPEFAKSFTAANAAFKASSTGQANSVIPGKEQPENPGRKGWANPKVQAAAQAAKGRNFSGTFKDSI